MERVGCGRSKTTTMTTTTTMASRSLDTTMIVLLLLSIKSIVHNTYLVICIPIPSHTQTHTYGWIKFLSFQLFFYIIFTSTIFCIATDHPFDYHHHIFIFDGTKAGVFRSRILLKKNVRLPFSPVSTHLSFSA